MSEYQLVFAFVLVVMSVWLAVISVKVSDREVAVEKSLLTKKELEELAAEFDGLTAEMREGLADHLMLSELADFEDDVMVNGVAIPSYYYLDLDFDPETYARKINASRASN